MRNKQHLILFERERIDGTAEEAFKDLVSDYTHRFAFKFVGRYQLEDDVFRKPDEDEAADDIRTERDILVVTLDCVETPAELMKVLDDHHHDTACGGYFSILGNVRCGWVDPVDITGWRGQANA